MVVALAALVESMMATLADDACRCGSLQIMCALTLLVLSGDHVCKTSIAMCDTQFKHYLPV